MRAALGIGALALLAGCGSPQGEETHNLEHVDTLAEDSAGVEEARPSPAGTAAAPRPAERTADEGEAVHATPEEDGAPPSWTAGRVEARSTVTGGPLPLVTNVRSGRHTEFDRVVFDVGGEGSGMPGYAVEYVDRPLHECGSGRQVQPVGDAWLQLRLEPAAGHTEAGQALIGREPRDPGLRQVLRIYRTCDFEGVVEFVLAVRSPEPFRVFDLDEPRRVVVDVRRR